MIRFRKSVQNSQSRKLDFFLNLSQKNYQKNPDNILVMIGFHGGDTVEKKSNGNLPFSSLGVIAAAIMFLSEVHIVSPRSPITSSPGGPP